jgi:hypothetical protein
MRLTPILIAEGRKEDLRKKYEQKFSANQDNLDTIDYALGHPFLAQTNFKYGDFLLKNLNPNASVEEVIDSVELIRDFDRFKESLEEKDINKYDLDGLQGVIDNHKSNSKSHLKKIDSSGAKKIYEDSNILIVKPLTFEASCKYGSGTRWCTTMANSPTYFNQYTSGHDQALYYVILKKFDRNNKFYKLAIHKKPGEETWYDSTDERMTDREKDVFNLGAPKVIETIRNDWEKELEKNQSHIFDKFFDWENYSFFNISKELRTNQYIGLEFYQSEITNSGEKEGKVTLNISLNEDNIDSYFLLISYGIGFRDSGFGTNSKVVKFVVSFTPNDNFPDDYGIDLEDGYRELIYGYDYFTNRNNSGQDVFHTFCEDIKKWVIYFLKNNTEFMSKIHGGKSVWSPNRSSYGYTFKENKGMVKKLVDYLDSGKEGTKLDFLVDIKSLEKKEIKGKPYYSRPGQNDWRIASEWRGQQSGFFNSAKLAGILDYDKKGNQFYLKKGPNFDKFKEGQLEAL